MDNFVKVIETVRKGGNINKYTISITFWVTKYKGHEACTVAKIISPDGAAILHNPIRYRPQTQQQLKNDMTFVLKKEMYFQIKIHKACM